MVYAPWARRRAKRRPSSCCEGKSPGECAGTQGKQRRSAEGTNTAESTCLSRMPGGELSRALNSLAGSRLHSTPRRLGPSSSPKDNFRSGYAARILLPCFASNMTTTATSFARPTSRLNELGQWSQ